MHAEWRLKQWSFDTNHMDVTLGVSKMQGLGKGQRILTTERGQKKGPSLIVHG